MHGVGASIVTALSLYIEATVYKDGNEYNLMIENGGKKVSSLKTVGKTKKTGTKIRFLTDFSFFTIDEEGFDEKTIINKLKESAYLNKKIKVNFRSEITGAKKSFYYPKGIQNFIVNINKGAETITNPIFNEGKKSGISSEIVIQYVNSYQPKVFSYVNSIPTISGGTHVSGMYDALLRIVNGYVSNMVKNSKERKEVFSKEDIKEGLVAIISIRHPNPIYDGQTKTKLSNIEVRKIVNDIISKEFEKYLLENPSEAIRIIEKVRLSAKSRLAALRAKEFTRKKEGFSFSTLPGKLADCSSKDNIKTELFIVEGDSAGGSAKMGRDRNYQAILPLRGKVINAEKTRIDKLLLNNEINSLIIALGININEEIKLEDLRYGKVIIMTDADVDGSHIRILLLTFFYRYLFDLIENGNVFIAQPPLYKISVNKTHHYAYTEKERKKIIDNLKSKKNSDISKLNIQRYKGLGEMNDEQLWETTMDPENRSLLKVTIENAQVADKSFTDLMGNLVDQRKEFISKNAKYAKLDL